MHIKMSTFLLYCFLPTPQRGFTCINIYASVECIYILLYLYIIYIHVYIYCLICIRLLLCYSNLLWADLFQVTQLPTIV